jgi:signal transduction histidine kinase
LPKSAWISADKIQIERLLYNLIDNGIKYTREGGFVEVEINNLDASNRVVIEIRDNGMGIAAEHLPHLFDRFYRVPSRGGGSEKGLGLGLSFVSWIVKAHGGEIQVRSELDRGTAFTVTFPRTLTDTRTSLENGNQNQTTGRYSHIGS